MEIGKLAVYLRQQEQLDADGIIAAQMAEDLADTLPAAMPETFRRLRMRSKFFPRPVELLEVYDEVCRERAQQIAREESRRAADAVATMLEDKRAHPEKYFSVDDLLRERGLIQAVTAAKPKAKRKKGSK